MGVATLRMSGLIQGLCCACLGLQPVSATGGASTPCCARDVAVPVFVNGGSQPAAIIRLGRVFTDYQRKGFFRIGLLPLLAAEDVEVTFLQGSTVSNALAQVQVRLERRFQRPLLELRRIRFLFPGETTPRLKAERMRPDSLGCWRLDNVVVFQGAAGPLQVASASLVVAGREPGRVRWRDATGNGSSNVFDPEPNPNP